MIGFIQTDLLYHIAMLVFLTVGSACFVFGGAMFLKWIAQTHPIQGLVKIYRVWRAL